MTAIRERLVVPDDLQDRIIVVGNRSLTDPPSDLDKERLLRAWSVFDEAAYKMAYHQVITSAGARFRGESVGISVVLAGLTSTVETYFKDNGVVYTWCKPDLPYVIRAGTDYFEEFHGPNGFADTVYVSDTTYHACRRAFSRANEALLNTLARAADVKKFVDPHELVPVVLYYDLDKLTRKTGYQYYLPETFEERAEVIRAAYPVDLTPLLPARLVAQP